MESFLLGYGLLSLHMGVPMVHSKVKSFHLIINTHTHTHTHTHHVDKLVLLGFLRSIYLGGTLTIFFFSFCVNCNSYFCNSGGYLSYSHCVHEVVHRHQYNLIACEEFFIFIIIFHLSY